VNALVLSINRRERRWWEICQKSLVLSQSGKDSVRFSFNFLGWFSFRFRKIHMYTRRCITNVKATGFIAVAIQISQIYNERGVGWVLSESLLIKVAMIGFLSPPFLWQIDRPVEGCVLFPCKRNQWINVIKWHQTWQEVACMCLKMGYYHIMLDQNVHNLTANQNEDCPILRQAFNNPVSCFESTRSYCCTQSVFIGRFSARRYCLATC
jgi:hypothetical protein